MIKYIPNETTVVFSEIPDEVSLAINISNCQNNCIGCHSPYLKGNTGEELTLETLESIVKKNDWITCICFMGEGNDAYMLKELAKSQKGKFKIALYSGREDVEDELYDLFDYVKIGPYKSDFGPLNKETTNQKLFYNYWVGDKRISEDITYKFWKRGI